MSVSIISFMRFLTAKVIGKIDGRTFGSEQWPETLPQAR